MSTSNNIAVIGDPSSVLCFKAVGVTALPATTAKDVNAALEKTYKENYAVVFITEELEAHITDNLRNLISRSLMCLVLIPGSKGSLGIGMSRLNELVNKAVGVNLD